MPELPEVECIRRGLHERLLTDAIVDVRVHRASVIHPQAFGRAAIEPAELLAGSRVVQLERHGKQLALIGACGRVVCIRLGMSGQLLLRANHEPGPTDHVHVEWLLRSSQRLLFRDPRRFGGLWLYPEREALERQAWSSLGPDALTISSRSLAAMMTRTKVSIKAALLDQHRLAGVGNIYADEALFRSGIHPLRKGSDLSTDEVSILSRAIRETLRTAINAGGSTLRDYVNVYGQRGKSQDAHAVYGRADLPCLRCGQNLRSIKVTGRTTTFCPSCQSIKG